MGSSLLGTLARAAELGEENAKQMKKGGKVKKKTKHHRCGSQEGSRLQVDAASRLQTLKR
jgi:hypothetical protein